MSRLRASWRGPSEPGEFPTLGYQVGEFIEAKCAIPDGDRAGEAYLLTEEMWRFLVWHYRLELDGTFTFRRSQLVRPQKWGKGPLSASLICAEADGPVLFDGWDGQGDPVGRPWATPWIQVTAVSEDQTDNVWRALLPMIELGDITADISDTGETRINLAGGGRIEPVTASARSRLGQRITFAVQDETHSWVNANGGIRLADNQRRNLAGMNGRSIETTNAWDPTEHSVAQLTHESLVEDVYKDFPDSPKGSFGNKRERGRVLRGAYGDSWIGKRSARVDGWVTLDRIDSEVDELWPRDPQQAERFFGNRIVEGAGHYFDLERWQQLAKPELVVEPGSLVVVGVDGARFRDALAMTATDVVTGHQWTIDIIERPDTAGDDYEHDAERADAAMIDLFDRYDVWRAYIDPQWIDHLMDRWSGRWGDKIRPWLTHRYRATALALRAYRAAQTAGDVTHDGDPVFAAHIGNAVRRPIGAKDDEGRPLSIIEKPSSGLKIDAAMSGTLSWEARGDAIAADAQKTASSAVYVF